ncbi:permease [Natronococcus sp. A-GB7]|uniref:permease n=1 Tax=Natronococcus sp. A-GB7 TaxID=3037649 RepID=UPI00241D4C41|nr:permease [Natronococcus sp. A-GB7]MDG5819552.1 permease [Natronococcus sp. A-GB7]
MIGAVLEIVGEGLYLAVDFLWQALWALLLGFMISGAIQAFVSKEGMVNYMGEASPKSVLYAMGFGTASTSCSFGDIAATKTLFKKGAHIIPTVAFKIASTNFVIGLTFVIWALLGWEFAVAQAVGAPIFILVAIALVHFWIPYDETQRARERLLKEEQPVVTDPVCKMRLNRENGIPVEHKNETVYFCSDGCKRLFEQNPDTHTTSWQEKVTSLNGWVEAANQTKKDLKMLWKELAIGFLLAGLIAAAVPQTIWTLLFEGGGAGVTQVAYNSVLGPLISVATFVGSMGNVPLAAVLWESGFAFAGVIAFLYADLIVPQLIRIYRKIWGKKIGTRISIILFVSMATTGFIVYYLFAAVGLIPDTALEPTGEGVTILGFEPITILNVLFLMIGVGFIALLIRGRKGAPGDRAVEDPVTGTDITVKKADYCTVHDESIYYFESDDSRAQFRESPESYL